MSQQVHVHSYGHGHSFQGTAAVDPDVDVRDLRSTKIKWAEVNAHNSLPQFAPANSATNNFAAEHLHSTKTWRRRRAVSSDKTNELPFREAQLNADMQPYAGLDSSLLLAAAIKSAKAQKERQKRVAGRRQPDVGDKDNGDDAVRHHKSGLSNKPPRVPVSAFLGESANPSQSKTHRSQISRNDDMALQPEKPMYTAELEYWREHSTASKATGARVREVFATMKLYPKKLSIQRQCTRRLHAALNAGYLPAVRQLHSQKATSHFLQVLASLLPDNDSDELQYLMLVLLCDMVCMARPSEYYALFYDDAIAAKKSFLGCLCTYMRRSKPSDPKIIAAVSAIIHAWLGRVPEALNMSRESHWGEAIMPAGIGRQAEATIKASVLRRLRRDAKLLRAQIAKAAKRYGHTCPPVRRET